MGSIRAPLVVSLVSPLISAAIADIGGIVRLHVLFGLRSRIRGSSLYHRKLHSFVVPPSRLPEFFFAHLRVANEFIIANFRINFHLFNRKAPSSVL